MAQEQKLLGGALACLAHRYIPGPRTVPSTEGVLNKCLVKEWSADLVCTGLYKERFVL